MKKFMIALITAGFMLVGVQAGAKEWKEVKIGVEGAVRPFSLVDKDGKLQGFDIDIAYALCDAMKVKCTLVKQDFDGLIPSLLAKKIDAIIASMWPSPRNASRRLTLPTSITIRPPEWRT